MTERRAKSWVLIQRHYAHIPLRDAVTDSVVLPLLRLGDRLLDAGCGDTLALLQRYAPRVSFAVGVDLVRPSAKPPARGAVMIGDLAALPIRDETFDVVVSRSVVEHLEHPMPVFKELARVLKPGGRLVFTTPNKYYYASLIAGMIPYGWKDLYMRKVFGNDGYDHFPVFYRANTRRSLRRLTAGAGLRLTHVRALRHYPYYLMFSPMRAGWAWLTTGWSRGSSLTRCRARGSW